MISINMTTACRYQNGLLQKAIESVLAQDYKDFELVICDDASTDGTADYLKELAENDSRVKIITNKKNVHSVAVSLARCFEASSKPYITWFFDDNVMRPGALKSMLQAIESDPELDFVYGQTICHLPGGKQFILGTHDEEDTRKLVENSSVIVPNAGMLIRKEFFKHCGWYDASVILRRSTDWDLFRRMIKLGKFRIIPQILTEEFGELEASSLRNSYTTSLELMKKFCQIRDLAGWETTLEAALQYPEDRIPKGIADLRWSAAELRQLYFMNLEYYMSVRNWPKALEWARQMAITLELPRWWISRLQSDSTDGQVTSSELAYCGIIYGMAEEQRSNEELLITFRQEIHHKNLEIQQKDIELNSLRHRVVDKINQSIKQIPFIHSALKKLVQSPKRN